MDESNEIDEFIKKHMQEDGHLKEEKPPHHLPENYSPLSSEED